MARLACAVVGLRQTVNRFSRPPRPIAALIEQVSRVDRRSSRSTLPIRRERR